MGEGEEEVGVKPLAARALYGQTARLVLTSERRYDPFITNSHFAFHDLLYLPPFVHVLSDK